LIILKNETERTVHAVFFLLNKEVSNKLMSGHSKFSFHSGSVKWSRTTSHQSMFRILIIVRMSNNIDSIYNITSEKSIIVAY